MPQSLAQVTVHAIFSTKLRNKCLDFETQIELHAYLATVLRNLGAIPIKIGGHEDHLHMLFNESRTQSLAKTMEVTKSSTSQWLKTKGDRLANFSWQGGYGAFGVSHKDVPLAIQYISNQHEHHRVVSFQDELRSLLTENGVEFDEKYLWD
ncbi:MAG TPA: transposase [Fimbriimonas sp.]|nr:transposase [Fimbriimonas sp.]